MVHLIRKFIGGGIVMQTQIKLAIGCDLAAYDFKMAIIRELKNRGYTLTDVGCNSSMEGDYPDIAKAVAELVSSKKVDRGILQRRLDELKHSWKGEIKDSDCPLR